MSKEIREQIDRVKNWRQFLNESVNNDLIKDTIDEKMDQLIGRGDYYVGYSEEQDRFIISLGEGDIESSCEMADEVVNYVNNHLERNILRVGNCGETMFWLTWFNNHGKFLKSFSH